MEGTPVTSPGMAAQQQATPTAGTMVSKQNPTQTQEATLIQNAISSHVDGLATTLPTPDAIGPTAQQAVVSHKG